MPEVPIEFKTDIRPLTPVFKRQVIPNPTNRSASLRKYPNRFVKLLITNDQKESSRALRIKPKLNIF